jgi:D-sedoheptulose 7-phosphate isomerase
MRFNEWFRRYRLDTQRAINEIPFETVEEALKVIRECKRIGGTVWIVGNGGSANLAQHFATDLMLAGVKAQALIESGMVTCMGNDFGWEHCFSRQLEELCERKDIVIGISGSGNSKNILNALGEGMLRCDTTIAIVGFDGGDVRKYCGRSIVIHCPTTHMGNAQDAHHVVMHLITYGLQECDE